MVDKLIHCREKCNRLSDAINKVKKLVYRARQYDRLASSIYNILDEVEDIVGNGIKKSGIGENKYQKGKVTLDTYFSISPKGAKYDNRDK